MTISKEDNFLTLINTFTVTPENQQELLDLLTQATQTVRTIPGFISSALHRSLDGTKVVMYAQWKSMEDYNRMRANPSASPFLERALKMATFQPGMFEVIETFSAS